MVFAKDKPETYGSYHQVKLKREKKEDFQKFGFWRKKKGEIPSVHYA